MHSRHRDEPPAGASGQSAADLLRALHDLAPVDPSTYLRIARLIDPAWPAPSSAEATPADAQRKRPDVGEERLRRYPSPASGPGPEPAPRTSRRTEAEHEREMVPSSLSLVSETPRSPPAWLQMPARFPVLKASATAARGFDPLMVPDQARGILSASISTLVETRKIDVNAAVRRIALNQPLRPPPLMRAPALAPRVQLLLDRSEAMLPFLADLRALSRDVGHIVGTERLEVLRFDGCPSRGAGPGSLSTWSVDYALRPPAPGSAIIVATDLGIGVPSASDAAEWTEYAQLVAQAGCRLLALVPYGPKRWPHALLRHLEIVHLDRSTSASRAAAFVRHGLATNRSHSAPRGEGLWSKSPDARRLASVAAFAVRVDPPLLRALRLELMPDADAGTEADVWAQGIVRFRGPDGFVFDPQAADDLRRRLAEEDAAAYQAAWVTTERMHGDLPKAIRAEEELRYLHHSPRTDASERIRTLLRAIVAGTVSEGKDFAAWAARAIAELPEDIRDSDEGRMMETAARLRLPGRLIATPDLPPEGLPEWIAWVLPEDLPRVSLGVQLLRDEIELSVPPAADAHVVKLPATTPLTVEVASGASGARPRRIDLEPGTTRRVAIEGDVVLRSVEGHEWTLRRQADTRAVQRKVAVLGGGIGALAAAFSLTAPEHEGRYVLTVYLPGWRLGGKCASGRSGLQGRTEEHGLHLWFGFYANAFDLIQRCYAEWRPQERSPLRTWQDAFMKCNDIVLFEYWKGECKPWHLYFPPDDLVPGTRDSVSAWEFLRRTLEFLRGQWGLVRERHGALIPEKAKQSGRSLHLPARVVRASDDRVEELDREAGSHVLELAFKVADAGARDPGGDGDGQKATDVKHLLEEFKRWLFHEVLQPLIDNDDVRRFAILLDFWTTTVRGMVAENVFEEGFGMLNGEDLRAWLMRHGADALTLEHASLVQALYDLVFAYRDGDKRLPDLAAGKALQALIRIVTEYRGAVLWKMQAGMGDVVFAPLYDVLARRGVRFRFFHQVTRLGVSSDGSSVASIEVQPQVGLRGERYSPLVSVGGLRCWPSEPRWQLLEDGESLRDRGVNFEREGNPLGLEPITLEAGKDFDEVVLGIPVGALPPVSGELAARNEAFRQMLETSDTVMTEGIQLWLTRSATELGWPYEPAVATSYVERADTYANMPQILALENWKGSEPPADLAYLSGVLRHEGIESQADADARVRENALEFLRHDAHAMWPLASGSGDAAAFDWNTLADGSGADGEGRLDGQHLRANFQPSDRYVMTRAGSVQYRLRADEAGFANLTLAGDWTRNGLDGGSVEAAVTSGMQAARAISGYPREIQGESGWLVDD